jgi:hypothetical protein
LREIARALGCSRDTVREVHDGLRNSSNAPSFNVQLAAQLAALGAPVFACTPDRFPELMGAAIGRKPLTRVVNPFLTG